MKITINLIGITLWLIYSNLALGDITISGQVFYFTRTEGTGEPEYKPLPKAKISVYRGLGVYFDQPKISDIFGMFSFSVSSGEPFTIIFHSIGTMPRLQELAGVPGYSYKFAVALDSIDDFIKKKPSLKSIEIMIENVKDKKDDESKAIYEQLMIVYEKIKSGYQTKKETQPETLSAPSGLTD